MWRYYLLSCAGAFRARDIQLWQWVLSVPGRRGVYARLGGGVSQAICETLRPCLLPPS
jgi:hypothetical protein